MIESVTTVASDKDKINSVKPGGRANSLILKKANQMVRKLESVKFNVPAENEKVIKTMRKSRFLQKRKLLGRRLSLHGRTALAILPNKNEWFIDVMDINETKSFGNIILLIMGTTGAAALHNNVPYLIITKYFLEEGKVMLERYIEVEEKDSENMIKVTHTEAFDTKLKTIPVEIFENNYLGQSDVDFHGVANDLERLHYLDTEQLPEFERTRTMPHYNLSLTNVDPKDDSNQRDAGFKRYIAERGMASKLGGGQTMIPANGGVTFLLNQILFLESDIKDKLEMIQQAIGGNNKHILEIMVKDQDAVEMIEEHRLLREEHYNNFLNKLCYVLNEEPFEIRLRLSNMETSKLEQFEATIAGEKAKANNNTNTNEGE